MNDTFALLTMIMVDNWMTPAGRVTGPYLNVWFTYDVGLYVCLSICLSLCQLTG